MPFQKPTPGLAELAVRVISAPVPSSARSPDWPAAVSPTWSPEPALNFTTAPAWMVSVAPLVIFR